MGRGSKEMKCLREKTRFEDDDDDDKRSFEEEEAKERKRDTRIHLGIFFPLLSGIG